LGFRVQGSGFRVQGSGFRVSGVGSRATCRVEIARQSQNRICHAGDLGVGSGDPLSSEDGTNERVKARGSRSPARSAQDVCKGARSRVEGGRCVSSS